jgi:hypothetical protein
LIFTEALFPFLSSCVVWNVTWVAELLWEEWLWIVPDASILEEFCHPGYVSNYTTAQEWEQCLSKDQNEC